MAVIILSILAFIFYVLGGFLFAMIAVDISRAKSIPIIIFWPITMWFIK